MASAKARYYANQAKKGKITKAQASSAISGKGLNVSTPKVKSTRLSASSSSLYSMNPEDNPNITNAQAENIIASGLGNAQSVAAARAAAPSKNDYRVKESPKSNRSTASRLVNATSDPYQSRTKADADVANPFDLGSTIRQGASGLAGMAKSIVNKGIGAVMDSMGGVGKLYSENSLNLVNPNVHNTPEQLAQNRQDLESALGLRTNTAYAMEDALAKSAIPDQPTGYGPNGETFYNGADRMFGTANQFRPGTAEYSNPGGARVVSSSPTGGQNPRTNSSNPTRTPRFIAGGSQTDLTPVFQPQAQDVHASPRDVAFNYPDFTPSQDNPGTQRQFLGNGLLSNGMASNGKGDYGIQGTLRNTDMGQSSLSDDLLTVLGLKTPTAYAAEMPNQMIGQSPLSMQTTQNPLWFGAAPTGMSSLYGPQGAGEYGSIPKVNATNTTPTPTITSSGPGGSRNGGVAQQYAQPKQTQSVDESNPVLDYQKQAMKGFSAQEKAQKKALDALLKSIRGQYATKQTEGINDLNTSKQQDLLKLAGLFQFANQSPDSEQRIQYEQRANQDYAKQQADFIAKLAAAQAQDVSQANQGYQSKLADIMQNKNSVGLEIAKLIQQAKEDAANRSVKGSGSASKRQSAITTLLKQAANLPSGGREYAQQIANAQGLGNISQYTPNGWETAYNPNFGKVTPQKFTSIGNGYVMDPATGDVFQAYDPNTF